MTVVEYANRGIDWKQTHPGCDADVRSGGSALPSCGGEYVCPGCERTCGYCNGACDELGELCDDCAMVVLRYRKMFNPERAAELHDEHSGVFPLPQ